MGLFNLFKKPVILNDGCFGAFRFEELKDRSRNYFEGKGHFAPTNSEIEYLIEADKNGPTDEQKIFYQELQSNFNKYINKIKPVIEDEFKKWKEDFEIQEFIREFELVCITIPRIYTRALRWEMSFTTIHDENHHVDRFHRI